MPLGRSPLASITSLDYPMSRFLISKPHGTRGSASRLLKPMSNPVAFNITRRMHLLTRLDTTRTAHTLTTSSRLRMAMEESCSRHLQAAADKVDFKVPEHHREQYESLLRGMADSCKLIMSLPDYFPPPAKYTRDHIHYPLLQDNEAGAWAWRATIMGAPVGPLKGRTVCLKDNICLAGVPLLFGTKAFTDYTPSTDATVVKRVLDAGAIIVGKATCEVSTLLQLPAEHQGFSHGPDSFSSASGPVHNYWARGFSAGGSSSGCGTLVASGEVDMAIGGDQGGSIRIPASLGGFVGLKPTFGLVPYTGILSSEWGADHCGPMTTTAYDCALLLEAIAGYDGIDDRQLGAPPPHLVPKYAEDLLAIRDKGLGDVRIGVLSEGFVHAGLDARVAKLTRNAIEAFAALKASVVEVSATLVVNKLRSCQTRLGRQVGSRGLSMTDYYNKVLPWTQDRLTLAGPYVTDTLLEGEFAWSQYPTVYSRANNIVRQLRDEYDSLLESVDVLVMPTLLQPARRLASYDGGPLDWATASREYYPDFLRRPDLRAAGIIANTASFNLTNHPAISIPIGFTSPVPQDVHRPEDLELRLPVGLQLVAKRFDEAILLRLADAWERHYDWKEKVVL